MKLLYKIVLLVLLLPVLMFADTPWHTVSFGLLNNNHSATFHMEKFFFGVEFEKLSADAYYTEDVWSTIPAYTDPITGEVVVGQQGWIPKIQTLSINSWLLSPKFGKRFNLKSSDKIYSFIDISGYMTIPFIKINHNDPEEELNDDDDDDIDKDTENAIDQLLDFIGFQFAYGLTYKINEQLSFSTEVGYNHSFSNLSTSIDSDNLLQIKNRRIEIDSNSGKTYTKFSINYSF